MDSLASHDPREHAQLTVLSYSAIIKSKHQKHIPPSLPNPTPHKTAGDTSVSADPSSKLAKNEYIGTEKKEHTNKIKSAL